MMMASRQIPAMHGENMSVMNMTCSPWLDFVSNEHAMFNLVGFCHRRQNPTMLRHESTSYFSCSVSHSHCGDDDHDDVFTIMMMIMMIFSPK